MNIRFYDDSRGHQPVSDWIREIKETDGETFRKFYYLLSMLEANGKLIHSGVLKRKDIKKLKGTDIWQLRVNANRVLFFYYEEDTIVLTNQFPKKKDDTPVSEIKRAERYKKDWIQRQQ